MADDKKSLRCSFCGKAENQVHRMIQGPGVRICDECVQLCMSILDDGYQPGPEAGYETPDQLPTPREIKEVLISTSSARTPPRWPCPWRSITTISAFSSAAARMWSCRRATS